MKIKIMNKMKRNFNRRI